MANILVCGGGPIGLCTGMLLAQDGHRVTVLERDAAPPPSVAGDAPGRWARHGVAQFEQPHILQARFRLILEEEFPGLVEKLVDAGCVSLDWLSIMPPFIRDRSPRPGDERFRFVTGRRPTVEAVLAAAAADQGLEVMRGTTVAELCTGPEVIDGAPHVTGLRTADGERLEADLVIDAMGRRSRLAEWLEAAGGTPPRTESEECRFVYHSRYYRGPALPEIKAPPIVDLGTISLLTLPGDNGTWSVTVWAAASDTALRPLRQPEIFEAVVRACPLHAHWVDGEPLTDVFTTAGVLDRYRRFVVNGRPVATGLAAVGDAWACTNPSAGRGITVGLLHAQCLRDTVRSELGDPEGFVRAWDRVTESQVAPFYWAQIEADRTRLAQMDALRRGEEPPPPDPTEAAIAAAMMRDPDVFRGVLELNMCLALPDEVLARPTIMEKVEAFARARIWKVPGPNRSALLELLGGAGQAPPTTRSNTFS